MGTNPFPFGCGTVCCFLLIVAGAGYAFAAGESRGTTTTEHVDVIESNAFWQECDDPNYPLTHKLVFVQLLFRTWNRETSKHDIQAWKMVKEGGPKVRFDHDRGVWVCMFHDGLQLRRITATSFVETRSTFDPELSERACFPVERRRGLRSK
jgi:hypothetical protein